MNIKIPAIIHKEGDVFVSECQVLNIVSQGNDAKEAKNNLVEAVGLFFFTCFEMGTFDQVMKECGITPRHGFDIVTDNGSEQLDICVPFIAAQKNRECRA